MDKKDLLSYFTYLRNTLSMEDIYLNFDNDNYSISKLDINRIFRFIDSINNIAIEEQVNVDADSTTISDSIAHNGY